MQSQRNRLFIGNSQVFDCPFSAVVAGLLYCRFCNWKCQRRSSLLCLITWWKTRDLKISRFMCLIFAQEDGIFLKGFRWRQKRLKYMPITSYVAWLFTIVLCLNVLFFIPMWFLQINSIFSVKMVKETNWKSIYIERLGDW